MTADEEEVEEADRCKISIFHHPSILVLVHLSSYVPRA